ncbi:MAG: 1-deoxy-D-xylulose-5-phosphate reductoisomerase [Alphaproteobacteria bacterium]|nr:1-deoxy-D-xylulose-5-phosphate reductoisomerase [Alphaproteobacteria bacterium]
MRRVSIFGSTGSIGCNTVDLLRRQGGAEAFDVVALSGGRNVALLAQQARELRAEVVVTAHEDCFSKLRQALERTDIIAMAGAAAIAEAAAMPTDWTMSAIGGCAGLEPGLIALEHGNILALANKESLVAAGPLMLATAKQHGATILPVDSEHSAIFQALGHEDISRVNRMILTASGGPFRDWSVEQLAAATPEQALAHPNWDMGDMISVDSASMFNKALEMIEAKEFYGVAPEVIEVIIHPQSIIHSLVGFIDGSLLAHMGTPDMRFAIGYALNWPERRELPVEPLDLARMSRLDFEAPDEVRFPALRLAREVMALGGLAGAVLNAAKETAYHAFMARRIGFLDMANYVEAALETATRAGDLKTDTIDLDNVLAADKLARLKTNEAIALQRAS